MTEAKAPSAVAEKAAKFCICAASEEDVKSALKLDTTFTTDRIYVLKQHLDQANGGQMQFTLAVEKLSTSITKRFPVEKLACSDRLLVAKSTEDGAVVGWAELQFQVRFRLRFSSLTLPAFSVRAAHSGMEPTSCGRASVRCAESPQTRRRTRAA